MTGEYYARRWEVEVINGWECGRRGRRPVRGSQEARAMTVLQRGSLGKRPPGQSQSIRKSLRALYRVSPIVGPLHLTK